MRRFPLFRLFSPGNLIPAIIWTNVIVFIISLIFSGSDTILTLNPFQALTPSGNVLHFLGASGRIPIDKYHAWWSLVTANWIHGSLLHILFNMLALRTVGPYVIREFGSYRTFSIYTLAGAGGFYLSYLGGVPLTVGASSGICGLIGALLYYGKSRGGQWGQLVVRQTSGWIISLLLIGALVPRVNNWGHGGGLIAGIGLAWVFSYVERRRENLADRVLAVILAVITLLLLLRTIVLGGRLIFF